MRQKARALALVAAVLCLTHVGSAKGITRRVVVSSGDLPTTIEITEASALANVWAGDFIGRRADPPDARSPRYQVSFHVQPPRQRETRLMYVVLYVRDGAGGFVYLPGRGEEWYGLNVSTILRPRQDGQWHRASDSWSRAINTRLP